MELSVAPIVTNQFEYHPYLNQTLLIEECRRLNVSLTAYCGMAVGRVFGDPVLQEIGKSHGKSAAQVVLRWHVQRGDVVFPKSSNEARLKENFEIYEFDLNEVFADRTWRARDSENT